MYRLFAVALLTTPLLTVPLEAQRGGGGGGIGPRGAPPPAASPAFTLPTATKIREQANVADLLVEKRKKLGLNDAAVDSLKHLADAINARNEPHLAVYDSVRARMRAAMNGGGSPGEPRGERTNPMRESLRAVQSGREADIPLALAVVPADKLEEAKKLIADQGEDLQKSLSPRGPGGAGGRPPRP
jgi:hypothetical protein